jgi:hypothetical protein
VFAPDNTNVPVLPVPVSIPPEPLIIPEKVFVPVPFKMIILFEAPKLAGDAKDKFAIEEAGAVIDPKIKSAPTTIEANFVDKMWLFHQRQ